MQRRPAVLSHLVCIAALLLLAAAPLSAQQDMLTVQQRAVFDWAEYAYPRLFAPAGATTQSLQGYFARHYNSTNTYLGVRDQTVYAAGTPFAAFTNIGNGIRRLGQFDTFTAAMLADGWGVYSGEKLLVSEAVSKDANGGADWFELYNAGTLPVALADYQVKDDGADHPLRNLPALTLAAGDYVVITASETAVSGNVPQVAFNLGSSDRVQLYKLGVMMDELAWDSSEAEYGFGFGRFPGPLSKAETITPTPGAANKSEAGWSRSLFGSVGTLKSSSVHTLHFTIDQSDFFAMVDTYNRTTDKTWIEATVVIDGTTYTRVGVRLKGNSSLRSISNSTPPVSLPWLVKLDKFVKTQNHQGMEEFVVRSNNSRSALNEAVALELLDLAGLASQDALTVRFTVNGSAAVARLVIESPDGEWMAEEFAGTGALYKAESTGDYSYRGDDPALYNDVFEQEAGSANADMAPLIAFLKFINQANDATFIAELPTRFDIDAFATYLAMQDLVANLDDIDGPGNNSYLYYDTVAKKFTIVPWDYNLAFGVSAGGGGGGVIVVPRPVEPAVPSQGTPANSRPNKLVQRFLAHAPWRALYVQKLPALRAKLYGSGIATEVLTLWAKTVGEGGLVDPGILATEKLAISLYFK